MDDTSECAAQVALPHWNVWLLDTPLPTNLFTKLCLTEFTKPGASNDFSLLGPFRKKALACQQSVLLILFYFNFFFFNFCIPHPLPMSFVCYYESFLPTCSYKHDFGGFPPLHQIFWTIRQISISCLLKHPVAVKEEMLNRSWGRLWSRGHDLVTRPVFTCERETSLKSYMLSVQMPLHLSCMVTMFSYLMRYYSSESIWDKIHKNWSLFALSFLQNTPNFTDFKYLIITIVAIHIVAGAGG